MIISGGNPFFINGAGVGQNFGQIAAQILSFDVFYTEPVIVGLQIVGSSSSNPIVGFLAVTDPYTGVSDISTLQNIEQNVQTDPVSVIVTEEC